MKHWTHLLRAVVMLALLSWPTAAAADQAGLLPEAPPTAVVDDLHGALLEVMKEADQLGYQGRYDRLLRVLPSFFDLPFMAQKSVGRHWKNADEERRAQLVETFKAFTTANYAGNFDRYTGQTFETLGDEQSTHGTVLVRTRLVDPHGETVQLNYRVRPVDGRWKIIDIYLNGTVSELALRRSEYSSLIQREGFDSLLVALNEKITDLSATTPAAKSP
ncbi:MAG: ABC transporter substrate-binding protein [Myxococcota bacterium]